VGDTLSIRLFQALAAAVAMTERKVILTDSGNFPSDLYMAQGFVTRFGRDLELRVVEPEAVAGAMTEEVGVLMLTQVDYRTGRRHDMAALTRGPMRAGSSLSGTSPIRPAPSRWTSPGRVRISPSDAPTSTSMAGRARLRSSTSPRAMPTGPRRC
jgi:hypothetical protein